jgi:hypothetical protein
VSVAREGNIIVKIKNGVVRLYHSETKALLLERPITPAFQRYLAEMAKHGKAQRQDLN